MEQSDGLKEARLRLGASGLLALCRRYGAAEPRKAAPLVLTLRSACRFKHARVHAEKNYPGGEDLAVVSVGRPPTGSGSKNLRLKLLPN
jgi:hypothetical protein